MAEHLVARTFAGEATRTPAVHASDEPGVVVGVLQSDDAERLIHHRHLLVREVTDDPAESLTGWTAAACSARTYVVSPSISTSGRKLVGLALVDVGATNKVESGRCGHGLQ